ncbi:MAG TPA: glycosyltransferase family 2 protein [Candidatus Omnitrophota bacterium]|nr:glycosyltransferase family 2 protein [Candidatus Omnitrophota bacterium]
MQSTIPFISFIVPVYNEELNIERMLTNLYAVLTVHPEWNWEVVIVEDGSKDQTKKVLQENIHKFPQSQLIIHEVNQGYTQSLKDGLKAAQGQYLMYVGADEEFDSSELPNFVNLFIKNEADLVLGVRWQRNAYGLFRFFVSVIYIFFLNWLFKIRINDYNWSQGWSRKALDAMPLQSKSLFILPEIIIRAHDLGFRIKEVPSNHRGRQWGKSSLNFKIMGFALWEGLKFYFRRKSSQYAHKPAPSKA